MKYILILLRWIAALLFAQTLFFKFSGAPESIYIFETVGMEPWGRYGSGLIELITAILLIIPGSAWAGALLGLGTISGAIFFHLTRLGIVVLDDGGTLFILACIIFCCCAITLVSQRKKIPIIGKHFNPAS